MKVFATLFEVMDKEPSLLDIWLLALIVGVGGFLLCRFRPWLIAVMLPIALLFSAGHLTELHDPVVGKYILIEAGHGYYIHSYVAMVAQVVLPCFALVARKKKLP